MTEDTDVEGIAGYCGDWTRYFEIMKARQAREAMA